MLKKCPHHGLQGWVVTQTLFGGLHPQYKNDITAAVGGALMNKTYEEAVELIENLAEHSYATPHHDQPPSGLQAFKKSKSLRQLKLN